MHYFFVNLIYGLWFAALPFGEDRTVIPWAVATWVLVLLGLAVLGKSAQKIGRTLLMAVFLVGLFALIAGIPYVLANGGWDKTKRDLTEAGKAKAAEATPSGEQITWVTLRGFDECSDIVDLDAGPSGENFFGFYPAGTIIRFIDHGDEEILLEDLPDTLITASGRACFLGPAGGRVRVRQVPN